MGNPVVEGTALDDPAGTAYRIGLEYYNGKSDQFEFFNQHENKLGLALWYDY